MCGGGPDQVTSTTRSEPSPLISGQISQAANVSGNSFEGAATGLQRDLLGQGFGNGSGPEAVNQVIGQSLGGIIQRGLGGSPLTGAAQDLTQQTIQGNFLSPDTNPYLQQTFNRAADLTRTRLSSEFAGAGRDAGAARPARSEELQTLASNIFGGNFQAERGRQMNAVNQAMPLAQQDFTDLQQAFGATQLPLDTLINRINTLAPAAGGTAISSQPVVSTGLFGGLF